MKCISLEVYRNARGCDCTNNGISSRFDELLVPHQNGYIDVDENDPRLCKIIDGFRGYKYLEPYAKPKHLGWMAGGNYASSSDSRFSELFGTYGAIAIHDRQETQEEYDLLSR